MTTPRYLGSAEVQWLAQALAASIVNGNWNSVVQEFGKLTPFQAVATFHALRSHGATDSDLDRLSRLITSKYLNDWAIGWLEEPLDYELEEQE